MKFDGLQKLPILTEIRSKLVYFGSENDHFRTKTVYFLVKSGHFHTEMVIISQT